MLRLFVQFVTGWKAEKIGRKAADSWVGGGTMVKRTRENVDAGILGSRERVEEFKMGNCNVRIALH